MPNIWDDPPDIILEDDPWDETSEYPDDPCADCPRRGECDGTEEDSDDPLENPPVPS